MVRSTLGRSFGPMTTSATTATTPSSDQAMSNIAAYPLVTRQRRRGNPAPDWGIAPGETAGGATVMRGLAGRGAGIGAAPERPALLVDHRRLGCSRADRRVGQVGRRAGGAG